MYLGVVGSSVSNKCKLDMTQISNTENTHAVRYIFLNAICMCAYIYVYINILCICILYRYKMFNIFFIYTHKHTHTHTYAQLFELNLQSIFAIYILEMGSHEPFALAGLNLPSSQSQPLK
jgi:hypothetical protein